MLLDFPPTFSLILPRLYLDLVVTLPHVDPMRSIHGLDRNWHRDSWLIFSDHKK